MSQPGTNYNTGTSQAPITGIKTLTDKISQHTTDVDSLKKTIADLTAKINDLTTRTTANESNINQVIHG